MSCEETLDSEQRRELEETEALRITGFVEMKTDEGREQEKS